MKTEQHNSPKQRGERLRQARKLARLTLKAMSESSEINFHTLSGWEAGRHNGLTAKGAKKVIDRLSQAGVQCSEQWLLTGLGSPPQALLDEGFAQGASVLEVAQLHSSLLAQQHPDWLRLTLTDNSMAPHYFAGDFVAGARLDLANLLAYNGKVVIAKLADQTVVCRSLAIDKETQQVSLLSLSPEAEQAVLFDVTIEQFALIVFHIHVDPAYQPSLNNKDY